MKKVISLILVLAMCLSLCACGGSTRELETETLELLNDAYSYCHTGMNYMLRGWDFSIQHSNDDTNEEWEALWGGFSSHMGMTEDEIVDALMYGCGFTLEDLSLGKDPARGLNTVIVGMLFMKANYGVNVSKYVFRQRNEGVDLDAKLEQIKTNLQTLGEKSKAYEQLKGYYLMVCEMQNWIDSPSGSYNSSFEAMNGYERDSESYNQELELIIG